MGAWAGWKAGLQTGKAEKLAARGVKAAEKVEGGFLHGIGHRAGRMVGGGSIRGGIKAGMITAAVAGTLGAVGLFAMGRRGAAKRDSKLELDNADLTMEQPAVPTPPAMQPVGLPPQEVGPAEGRAPGEWTQRVAAQRGMEVGQPQGPSQPAQSVMPEDMVGKLGASGATPQPGSR